MTESKDVWIRDPLAGLPDADIYDECPSVEKETYEKARQRCQELASERDDLCSKVEELHQHLDKQLEENETQQHALEQQAREVRDLTEEIETLRRTNESLRRSNDQLMMWGREEQARHRDTRFTLMHALQDELEHRDPEDALDERPPFFSRERPKYSDSCWD